MTGYSLPPQFREITNKKILVSALNWGIGHASRMVPVIRGLANTNDIILSTSGSALHFWKLRFPHLSVIEKPSALISYSSVAPAYLKILVQSGRFNTAIKKEKVFTSDLVKSESIDIIISDNCYGMFHNNCRNIFITHQLRPKLPYSFSFADRIIEKQINKYLGVFDSVFVPDYADERSLSGELSHNSIIHADYIGPLSRFSMTAEIPLSKIFSRVAIISGPEPQRSILEDKCKKYFSGTNDDCLIIRGRPENTFSEYTEKNITFCNDLPDEKIKTLLLRAGQVICRSGYSTLMDLHILGKKALLIPTPGQTEQEYLAELHSGKGFEIIKQRNFGKLSA